VHCAFDVFKKRADHSVGSGRLWTTRFGGCILVVWTRSREHDWRGWTGGGVGGGRELVGGEVLERYVGRELLGGEVLERYVARDRQSVEASN
jgi:hypothetical protein